MRKRFSSLLAVSFLLCGLLAPVSAQAPDPLPACQAWTPAPHFYPSPSIATDNTLYDVGGSPPGSGLAIGVLKSTDRGRTWQRLQSPEAGPVNFSSNYAADQALAVVAYPFSQAHISQDGGLTWRTVAFPRPAANAFALGDAQHLYAGYGREMPPDQQVPRNCRSRVMAAERGKPSAWAGEPMA